nr:phage tail protein [Rhodobium orientis]
MGPHIFDIMPLNYQRLEAEVSANWPAIPHFGSRPGAQLTGFGENPITISGLLFPQEFGGRTELEAVKTTLSAGKPVSLIGWAGFTGTAASVFGMVVLLRISTSDEEIGQDGLGREVSYEIEVKPKPGLSGRWGLF